jgi:hypothetical protein
MECNNLEVIIVPSISELIKTFFLSFDSKPVTSSEDEPVPLDLAGPFPFYKYKGEIMGEAVYKQTMEKIYEERFTRERVKNKIKNIAAVKRRFANHDEILTVIDKLSEEHKNDVLDFLVSLRKKQRDEFDWVKFKDELLVREEAYLKIKRERSQ